ncbi:gluconokinase [Robiginitomaculum antarcticum]|uniref:gluconokinase n=1 Tax=Robiginitomaculum antarcticum TaxID=437507 RepID=UPI0003721231
MMGVSGCGKSTIGKAAARRLGLPFIEADDFHSAANKAKMAGGTSLKETDRVPWIEALVWQARRHDGDVVMSCSALTQYVRDRLQSGLNGHCRFIYLRGSEDLIAKRLTSRKGHFFNPALLSSQFAALEEPSDAEILDIDQTIDALVTAACTRISMSR